MEKKSDILGDIIRVDDANTYIAKIPPDAKKERIGRFVKITKDNGFIVGMIKNITNSIREDLIPYIEPDMAPNMLLLMKIYGTVIMYPRYCIIVV